MCSGFYFQHRPINLKQNKVMSTKINWTDETWNPIIGCSKISPGCKNCYAEKMAYRLAHMKKTRYYAEVVRVNRCWNGKTHFAESQLEKPLKWKKPRMIFVCSMGDLFHESVDFQNIIEIFHIINKCPQHTFQILTKRPERMLEFFEYTPNPYWKNLPNVWLGVTVENQKYIDRIYNLLSIPAKIHFISVEPMLGEVDLECFPETGCPNDFIENLDWVICGGESGHNARPMHPDWVRSLKDQCEGANVPFFFKQWGEWSEVGECGFSYDDEKHYNDRTSRILNIEGGHGFHGENAIYVKKVGKKNSGCLLDGKEYKQFPKVK